MKKMWLWAVVAILFVSSLAVFAGCEKAGICRGV